MSYDPALSRPAASDPHRSLSIQVLRAVAALSVVVHHAGYDADTLARIFGSPPLGLERFFDWTFGVHLFFVMSGFIMVRTARGFGQRGAPFRFLGRRLLRIVPLYWLMTTLVLAGALLAPSLLNVPVGGWTLELSSYLFIPARRINGAISPVLGQGWTLNYEMFFYLVFATAMMVRRRLGLALLAASLGGLVIVGRIARPSAPVLFVWTDPLLLEFLFGIAIGLCLEAGLRLGRSAALMLAIAGSCAAVLLGPLGGFDLQSWIAQGVPAAAILAACVWGPAWPPRPLVPALGALGDASYSLYLTHPFAIRLLRQGWAQAIGDRWPLSLFLGIAILATIALSILVFRLVERPMTSALRRRFPMSERDARPGSAIGVAVQG